MGTYTQLTQEQRYQLYALKQLHHSQSEIAQVLGVHRSTISRELRRNTGARGYRPKQAQAKAVQRRIKAKPRIAPATWKVVEEKLQQDWSPEQISGWLARRQAIQISHEWIYQHILADQRAGGRLYTHLRCYPKRRKRYGRHDRRGQLPNRVSIDQRPPVVEQRTRLGDWEADTLIGQRRRGALVSLVERTSRFTLIQPVTQCGADLVGQAVLDLLWPVHQRVRTITSDNGKEFANHVQVAEALQASFYFAHPYAAWERGTNENTNGLIRQYFPKQTDFSTVSPSAATDVANKLNHRPRKCLDFNTPFEVFSELPVALTS
jgi:IS30 family transposase